MHRLFPRIVRDTYDTSQPGMLAAPHKYASIIIPINYTRVQNRGGSGATRFSCLPRPFFPLLMIRSEEANSIDARFTLSIFISFSTEYIPFIRKTSLENQD